MKNINVKDIKCKKNIYRYIRYVYKKIQFPTLHLG